HFNNAGISIRKLPQDLTPEEWHRVMNVNLTSAFLVSKAVYPHMKQVGGGKIINIGSMTSYFGASFASPYATSKGGIVQLSKSLALARVFAFSVPTCHQRSSGMNAVPSQATLPAKESRSL